MSFLPNAIYKPEVCIRTSLEAARAHHFPISCILFEATEGEVISDGERLAHRPARTRSHRPPDCD